MEKHSEPDKGIFYYFVDAAAAVIAVISPFFAAKEEYISETGRRKRANTCQSGMFMFTYRKNECE